jgi:hypothetical protein
MRCFQLRHYIILSLLKEGGGGERVNLLAIGEYRVFFLRRILISRACYHGLIGICQGAQQKSIPEK